MSNLNRVQAGIPEGGQFSETTKTRPDVASLNTDRMRFNVKLELKPSAMTS